MENRSWLPSLFELLVIFVLALVLLLVVLVERTGNGFQDTTAVINQR